jgi:GNAT superfamily N-acetyltransferase
VIAGFTLRRATAADAEELARGAVDGVSGYGEFAPGWSGPGYEQELAHARTALQDPGYHAFVAEAGGAIAGQVAVLAADATALPAGDPELAHLRNLFVAREHWGSGVGSALLHAGEDDARERGFTAIRLFVAGGQARARRFYEREGWEMRVDAYFDPQIDFEIVEYALRP